MLQLILIKTKTKIEKQKQQKTTTSIAVKQTQVASLNGYLHFFVNCHSAERVSASRSISAQYQLTSWHKATSDWDGRQLLSANWLEYWLQNVLFNLKEKTGNQREIRPRAQGWTCSTHRYKVLVLSLSSLSFKNFLARVSSLVTVTHKFHCRTDRGSTKTSYTCGYNG